MALEEPQPTAESTYYRAIEAPYALGGGKCEADRLSLQHTTLRQLRNGNHRCRLDRPRRALDIGTGPGLWLQEMAEAFPECHFTGVDITPFLSDAPLPPNVDFQVMNILEGLQFQDATFDYVHQRLMTAAIPETDWPRVIAELARVCTVAGQIELTECVILPSSGGPLTATMSAWIDGLNGRRGIDTLMPERLAQVASQQAGLRVHEEHWFRYPLNALHGPVANDCQENLASMLYNLREKLIAEQHTDATEFDRVMRGIRDEWNAQDAYLRYVVLVIGRSS